MQQALLPLHLVTVGVGVAWLVRLSKTVNPTPKPSKGAAELGNASAAAEANSDADLERSATQWLARSGGGRSAPQSPAVGEHVTSSYAELELLAEGDFVYLRLDGNVLTALVPSRHLALQPLQLLKGKPGTVPTAPLEAISVWLVRRCKQQVVFELLGPHDRRHTLEADPGAPHGVALAGGSPGKRGSWLITPQGLASVRWPSHVLPLQVLAVHLLDSRAVKSVRDGLGQKVAELGAKLRQEEMGRVHAETGKVKLEAELQHVRNRAETQVAELRAQLDAAVIARRAAEREVATLQGQKADEAVRAKMAHARASQAEFTVQQAGATVRRQEQQIQGMLAEHAEELRTLQQELQIAREANEGLKRAMREQVLSLQGALELRDARILELEEENDRMDTVLQVIQAQLGGGSFPVPERRRSSAGMPAPQPEGRPAADIATEPASAAADAVDTSSAGLREPGEELSLSTLVGTAEQPTQQERRTSLPAGPPSAADEPPLWRSLLDLTGDLSVTALKESLAISRRNTVDDAVIPSAAWEPQPLKPPTDGASVAWPSGNGMHSGLLTVAPASPYGMAEEAKTPAGDWGSGGGGSDGSGGAAAAEEEEFVSAAARMSGQLTRSGSAKASPPQQPQVPGSAGGDMGFPSATRADPAGAGADAAARGGSSGGPEDVAAATRALFDGAALSGAGAAPGCNSAQLEYGMEATLTLDTLRRRMRQLEAERQRLDLLRVSLEESLPWRAGVSAGGGGRYGSRVGLCAVRSCGGAAEGGALVNTEGYQSDQKQQNLHKCAQRKQIDLQQRQRGDQQENRRDQLGQETQQADFGEQALGRRVRQQPSQAQGLEGQHEWHVGGGQRAHDRDQPAMQRGPCAVASPGCMRAEGAADSPVGQQQRNTDGGICLKSPVFNYRLPCASAGGAACSGSSRTSALGPATSAAAASPGSRIRGITEQLLSHSRSSSEGLSPLLRDAAAAGLSHGGMDACPGSSASGNGAASGLDLDDSLSFSCCSSGGQRTDEDACVIADPIRGRVQDMAAGTALRRVEGQAAEGALLAPADTVSVAAASAGRRLPGLAFDGRPTPRVEVPYGVYDSIDGLCNLGSTRALPTARGAGWQTARRVGHSRQPSAGVAAEVALPMPDVAPSPGGMPQEVPLYGPGRLHTHRLAGGAVAGGTPPATPKSCASGGDFGMDDDALVHCDDQERSPPPAMLLGPLDQLRGAAAMEGGAVRMGGRGISAVEDDEGY